ncbi:hypothetical protein DSL72_005818 [Monilinia vaccinii-corymbosi]|uniref:Uncharacterized protein n=1 Tax=Monilinia vaccinii-corymbosi TaxID=61207 RepID=A0A8A3PGB1_9HELO|nr:hypothetical protein DSL72_005818 [Monilinia vaccinii-corymbosi]
MDQIFKIKDAVMNYLSPVAKRRRTTGPQTPSCSRVDDEHQFLSEPRISRRDLDLAHDRMNQNFIASESKRTASRNPLKRPREDDEVAGPIFSGDEISPKLSSSQNVTQSGEGLEVNPDLVDDEDEEEDEDEISAQQKVNEYLANQAAELARAKETVERARAEGEWSPEEIFLLERLQYMGHEGLLPGAWKGMFFRTVPDAMWCDVNDNALLGNTSRGMSMLEWLVNNLGRRVHDRYINRTGPAENQMRIFIGKYVEWTEKIGGYHKKKFIPVLCLVKGRWQASAVETSKRLQDQMAFHAGSWRRSLLRPFPIVNESGETEIYFRRPPIIYGILYIQAKALFVTLDSSNPYAKIRDIHVCDFLDTSKHFWHAISVAIVANIAQKYMVSIKDGLEDDDPPEPNSDSDNELESRGQLERRLQKEARRLELEKERRRQEELLMLEQQMEDIKMEEEEEEADDVMESIEEYEKVDVVEGEGEEGGEEEEDRPSTSEYGDNEDEDVEVEFEENEDMVQSEVEVESGDEVEDAGEVDGNKDEKGGDGNEDTSDNEGEEVETGFQYDLEPTHDSTSSEEL